ncbi:MAG TPA: hypothetical protein VJY85_12420, partial [Candidatus Limnocylindria bacterium]|nr:hypothetical protein [Candidatus Limnocylindria bacterium]
PLGWVTNGHRVRTPAPALSVAQAGHEVWYVTVLAPSTAGDARVPQVRVAERGDALLVTVIRAERRDRFRIAADGTVQLADG